MIVRRERADALELVRADFDPGKTACVVKMRRGAVRHGMDPLRRGGPYMARRRHSRPFAPRALAVTKPRKS
jgi:hypothetical protein